MSTVENEQRIGPCPICGPLDEHDAPHLRRFNHICVLCPNCGAEGSKHFDKADAVAAWNALSDAPALARAVERLGAWLKVDCNHMFELEHFSEHEKYYARQMIFSRSGWSGHACGVNPDLAAALIALAEQIEDTP